MFANINSRSNICLLLNKVYIIIKYVTEMGVHLTYGELWARAPQDKERGEDGAMNASFGGANSDSMGVLANALVVAPLVGRIALLVGQCKSQALLANWTASSRTLNNPFLKFKSLSCFISLISPDIKCLIFLYACSRISDYSLN